MNDAWTETRNAVAQGVKAGDPMAELAAAICTKFEELGVLYVALEKERDELIASLDAKTRECCDTLQERNEERLAAHRRCHATPPDVDTDEPDRACAGRLERMAYALRVPARRRTASDWTSIGLASSVLRDIVMAGWMYRGKS